MLQNKKSEINRKVMLQNRNQQFTTKTKSLQEYEGQKLCMKEFASLLVLLFRPCATT